MPRRSSFVTSAACVALFAACSNVVVDDYDRTCTANSDCVTVAFGDMCDGCAQAFDAINAAALETYNADVAAAVTTYLPRIETRDCIDAIQNVPACADERCTMPLDGEGCPTNPCVGEDDNE